MDELPVNHRKVHMRGAILGVLGFTTVIAVGLIIRFLFGWYLQFELDVAYRLEPFDRYYDPAYIGENGYIYTEYMSLKGMYLMLCSCAFKMLGNVDGAVILLNIILEMIAVVFIYFAVKRIFGRLAAFIVALVCDLCPFWGELPYLWGGTQYLILWRENRLLFTAAAIGLYLLSFIKYAFVHNTDMASDAVMEEVSESQAAASEIDKPAKTVEQLAAEAIERANNAIASEDKEHAPADRQADGKVELLINPLPLPKRHEHKDIDYDYQVSDSDMKYDYEPEADKMHYDYE